MKTNRLTVINLFFFLFFIWTAVASAQQPAQQTTDWGKIAISTPEQVKEEFNSVPCKDSERLNAVKALFEKMGAPASDIAIENFKGVENLVVRKQGSTEEKIVVGAHYDKVPDGCGAVDNWTGIVTIAQLYKTLKDVHLDKTVLFVAFGKEEKGLIGSHAMAEAIQKDDVNQYCAMINIDSLGLAAPQVATNMSSAKLQELAANSAKKMQISFSSANIPNADSDSSSFLKKKIPALTIHGMTNDWQSILHTKNDVQTKVNPASVYLGYRLALSVLASVAESSCQAYR